MPSRIRGGYAPPGPYTETIFGTSPSPQAVPARIPLFIGTGREILSRTDLALVRGSSATVDTFVSDEDVSGHAVVSENLDGSVTLGNFDGVRAKFQVRNFPMVNGDGTGSVALDTGSVSVRINGLPVVVLSINAAKGLVEVSVAPGEDDQVLCTYFFDRTDTLSTDDVSAQVTTTTAIIDGVVGQSFAFTQGLNDVFSLSVDGSPFFNITLPSSASSFSAAVVVATINGNNNGSTLVASAYVDNFGATCIRLTADRSIVIGTGTANTVLGFVPGTSTSRNRTFTVFNYPIVNGNGGGVTTTNPADVTVLVNGVQVIPTAVDGSNGLVTLPIAPATGSTVTVRYFWNSWQDTFDYLSDLGVTAITRVGLTPNSSTAGTYLNGVSYVLKNDRILWGTAALVSTGTHTDGGATFGESQVGVSLVDSKVYMDRCSATVDNSGPVAVASRTVFQLSHQPTTGNGRGNPLGSDRFSLVSNGRSDLPTSQPSLVTAYWGFGLQDALTRGPVSVLKVDPTTSRITLAVTVPEGAQVFATYYYNTLSDQAFIGSSRGYTLKVVTPGVGGVGTYGVTNGAQAAMYGVSLASKGAALSGVTVSFPSGSEFFPDARIEGGIPVEETATVTFATSDATPARFVSPGPSPYNFIEGASDHLRVTFDGSDQQTGLAAGIDLTTPTGGSRSGAFASLVSEEITYSAASGETTYPITAGVDDVVNLVVDGVNLSATATASGTATAAAYVTAINAAAAAVGAEPYIDSAGSFPNGLEVNAGNYDDLILHYTGSTSGASGNQTITLTAGTYATVADLVDEINDQLATINTVGGLRGSVGCEATADARLRFTLTPSVATGILTFAGNASDTNTVVLNGKTYTFQTVLTNVNGNVLIGGSASASIDNLIAAINLTAGAGTTYAAATTLHPTISAQAGAGDTMVARAKDRGSAGNALTTTETLASGSWGAVTLTNGDDAGYLEFVTASTFTDFAILAGLDTDNAANGGQTKIFWGPIARRYTVTTTSSRLPYDRIVLRNRIFPGEGSLGSSFHILSQTGITCQGGTGATKSGLLTGMTGEASTGAVVKPLQILASVGWDGGFGSFGSDPRTGQPVVTFYDGTDPLFPANNVFSATINGTTVTTTFTASTGGTVTALGPSSTSTTVLGQISAALTSAGLNGFASVDQEGANIRLQGAVTSTASSLVIGAGSANDLLGFTAEDTATAVPVTARVLASTLMSHAQASGSFSTFMLTAGAASGYFAGRALATVVVDGTNNEYLFLQSLTLGTGSSILFKAPSSDSALATGTLLLVNVGDGASGRATINGFFVTSTDAVHGSGSSNTSVLNSGVGQDGQVGQTYVDSVTGLTFTILPRSGGLPYPTGGTATVAFRSSRTLATDGNIPSLVIPGVELTVTNTAQVVTGDTALVETFKKEGDEPSIGEIYYVSYNYEKENFTPRLWNRLQDVVAEYGPVLPDNPLSLAAYLAYLNRSSVIGTYQVKKAPGSAQASSASYLDAIDACAGACLPGNISPSVLSLLTPATRELAIYMARHCDVQSSIRYRAERTAIFGFASGTRPDQASAIAKATGSSRVRFVYPDLATITLTDVLNNSRTYTVDGRYIASALVAATTSSTIDSATPWESIQLVGFTSLGRVLDAVVANQTANSGITIIEDRAPFLRVRHGLTSDMSSILMKIPTVIQIADDIQQRARAVLSAFIGIKFLPGITGQIEGRLSEMFKRAIQEQIISSFTGVKVTMDPEDPTAILVDAYYQPVYPLLYIQVTFRVSSSQ